MESARGDLAPARRPRRLLHGRDGEKAASAASPVRWDTDSDCDYSACSPSYAHIAESVLVAHGSQVRQSGAHIDHFCALAVITRRRSDQFGGGEL
jgi:hypothetical protein